MAHQILKNCKLLVGGYDLSGDTNQLGLGFEAEMQDDTNFASDGTRVNLPGLFVVSADHSGMWNADPGDDHLFSQMGQSGEVMTVGVVAGADGEVAYSFQHVQSMYSPGGAVGDIFAFSLSAQGRGELVRGTILHDVSTAKTATGTGTARQLGAVDAGETLYGALHVIEASGTSPTLDVVVESDDDSGFASGVTRLTFDQATAVGSQWEFLAGAVADDWFRVSFTIGGTDTPTFKFLVNVGIR